jgi:pyruvate kinase
VFSGTDAVMLSGETATGDHPTLAAAMMSRIALEAESSSFFEQSLAYASRATSVAEAIARGACNTAREIGAKYLVAFTETGSSATNVSLARPHVPIIAFSPNTKTRRQMALLWGVIPRESPPMQDADSLVDWCTGDLMAAGLASPGERVVLVFGAPIGVSGSTNTIRVHVLS